MRAQSDLTGYPEAHLSGNQWATDVNSSTAQCDDGTVVPNVTYGWANGIREVLTPGTPFAVVRWTKLWFPAAGGIFGDWFGPLQPLSAPEFAISRSREIDRAGTRRG